MNSKEFREAGYQIVDSIASYYDGMEKRNVCHKVEPGYLGKLIPTEAPEESESFASINKDFHGFIMPGITHWQSGNFYNYYPCDASFPSILGEIYSSMISSPGFSWDTSPATTELEILVVDWLGKLLGLPKCFLSTSKKGFGYIQGTASEAMLVTLIAARERVCDIYFPKENVVDRCDLFKKLVSYCSDQTHSCAQKAGLILGLNIKVLPTDDLGRLRGETLKNQIEYDISKGLIPFHCVASIGTTGVGACDALDELVQVVEPHKDTLWIHVDAAYAGAALLIKKYQTKLIPAIEKCDSFNMNPHKWLKVNFDCSALWVRNLQYVASAFTVEASFFKKVPHPNKGEHALDFKDLEIPLGRRFRSLKLWFTLRSFGAKKLRQLIQKSIDQAKLLHDLMCEDNLYETVVPYNFSMLPICVARTDANESIELINKRTQFCAETLDKDPSISVSSAHFKDKFIIRVAIGSAKTTSDHIVLLYTKMKEAALLAQFVTLD